jgi:hypothetical protein
VIPLIEIPTTQIWDTKFQIGILDFKTLVSTWILVKNSNLEPWVLKIPSFDETGAIFDLYYFNYSVLAIPKLMRGLGTSVKKCPN